MPVKLRLQRHGRKGRPFYHIVAADSRAPRDGKFIEKVGTYNPLTVPATIEIDVESSLSWLQKGAQPTNTVRAILRFKGVMFKKHLQRGVAKGAFSQEEADKKWDAWVAEHQNAVLDKADKVKKEKAAQVAIIIEGQQAARLEKEAAKKAALEAESAEAAAEETASEGEEGAEEAPAEETEA